VRHAELTWTFARAAPAAQLLAIFVQYPHPVSPAVRHKHLAFAGQEHAIGPTALFPLGEEFAVSVKYLNAAVVAVADIDLALGVHADRVWQIELSRTFAFFAPLLEQLAVFGVFQDSEIAIAISDVKLAIGGNRDIGWPIIAIRSVASLAFGAEGQQQFAVGVKLEHLMIAGVSGPDVVVFVDAQAMRRLEMLVAPGTKEFAVGCENHDRIFAAMEDEDIVIGIGGHGGDGAEFEFFRE